MTALNLLAVQNAALLRELQKEGPDRAANVSELARRLDRDESNLRKSLKALDGARLVFAGTLRLSGDGIEQLAAIDRAEGDGDRRRWPIDRIRPNPANRPVDPDTIPGMADSIAARGLLQPLVLSPPDDRGIRMLWVGERRWRGLLMLADQHRTPADLIDGAPFEERQATAAEALAITLTENVERQNLTPLEEAFLLRDLADAWGEDGRPLTATDLADRLGRARQLRQIQIKLKIAREATPEAVDAYRRDGSWDALVASVQSARAEAPPAPARVTGPWILDGIDYGNATRYQEARYAKGLDRRPANAGGVASRATPPADPVGPQPEPLTDAQLLALVELAHQIYQQQTVALLGAGWTGNPDHDLRAFGAAVHDWWLAADFADLRGLGLIDLVQRPGGAPALAVLTATGISRLRDEAVPLPPGDAATASWQVRLGGGLRGFDDMATAWLNAPSSSGPPSRDAVPAEEGPPWDDADAEALSLPTTAEEDDRDEWGRTDDVAAADLALLDEALALDTEADDEDGPRDLAARLGFGGPFTVDAEGGLWCWAPGDEDERRELITVDVNREIPTERARAVALLMAWALNRALDHAGPAS